MPLNRFVDDLDVYNHSRASQAVCCNVSIGQLHCVHALCDGLVDIMLSRCHRPHWKSSASWPPEDLADQPRVLYLGDSCDGSRSSNGGSATVARHGTDAGLRAGATTAGQVTSGTAADAAGSASGSRDGDGAPDANGGVAEMPLRTFGGLDAAAPGAALRWRQEVDTSRYLKVRQ